MTVGRPLDVHGAALALATLKAVSEAAGKRLTEGKAIAADEWFRKGDRSVVSDPETGERLGLAWMTAPKPKVEITNRAALVEWAREERPEEDTQQTVTLAPGRLGDVIAVLAEHAPHLLTTPQWDLTEHGEAAILNDAKKRNAPPMPGVETRTPRGSITVSLDEGGADRILELVAQRALDPVAALPATEKNSEAAA